MCVLRVEFSRAFLEEPKRRRDGWLRKIEDLGLFPKDEDRRYSDLGGSWERVDEAVSAYG